MSDDANAVIHDMKTDINMPFVLNYKKGEIELKSKTVMRKKTSPLLHQVQSYRLKVFMMNKLDEVASADLRLHP